MKIRILLITDIFDARYLIFCQIALINIYPQQHLFTFLANISFDVGLAVFYSNFKISPQGYQKAADQDTLKNLVRFLDNDADDANGRLVHKGFDDLEAFFYGKAYHMFMNKCPALLTGFKKVQEEIKSDIYD